MSTGLYNIALVTHVVGITIMAGTTFIDLVAFNAFWKLYQSDKTKAFMLEGYLNKLQRFMGIGMLVILVSGVLMMVKLHEVWGAQTWFRIKMGVLLLIIINGLGLRRILGSKLKKSLTGDSSVDFLNKELNKIKKNLTAVQLIQVLLFLVIYILSVFKFN